MEQRINGMSGEKTRDSIPAGGTYTISADGALSQSALIMTTVSPQPGSCCSLQSAGSEALGLGHPTALKPACQYWCTSAWPRLPPVH